MRLDSAEEVLMSRHDFSNAFTEGIFESDEGCAVYLVFRLAENNPVGQMGALYLPSTTGFVWVPFSNHHVSQGF